MLVLSNSWAKPKGKGKQVHYSESKEIKKGHGGTLKIVYTRTDKIEAKIKHRALDSYMEMLDLDKVEISVELKEEWVKCGDGHHYYLDFTFSPSGAFFDQPLELKIQGKYVESDCHV